MVVGACSAIGKIKACLAGGKVRCLVRSRSVKTGHSGKKDLGANDRRTRSHGQETTGEPKTSFFNSLGRHYQTKDQNSI